MPLRDRTDDLSIVTAPLHTRSTRSGAGRSRQVRGGPVGGRRGRGRRVAVRLVVVLTVLGLMAAGGWA